MTKIMTFEVFVEKATIKHNGRYRYDPCGFNGANKITKIICDRHDVFYMNGSGHLAGRGCQNCAAEKRSNVFRASNLLRRNTDFYERANLIHGDTYDYSSTVYEGLRSRIKIICKIHGTFDQMAQAHIINGQGCPSCAQQKRFGPSGPRGPTGPNRGTVPKAKFDKSVFLSMLSQEQNNFYDYSLVKTGEVLGKIEIICPIHGIFVRSATQHISNRIGCKPCGTIKRVTARANQNRLSTDDFITRAIIRHGEKYDYSSVIYLGMNGTVKINCRIHGEFEQRAGDHLTGNGCQKCGRFATSYMEIAWLDSMNINIRAKKIKIGKRNLIVDGFCPRTNTVFEFLGDYWHGNPEKYHPDAINARSKKRFGELYEHTMNRIALLEQTGYKVVHKWEKDWLSENRIQNRKPLRKL